MSDSPYTRVYWSVMDDEKFDGIREDCRLFGAWSLMLVVADMAWPAPAYVPPTVPRGSVRRLVETGLVDELPGHRYRIHGLDRERGKRSDQARANALRRYSNGSATAGATAEQRQSKRPASRAEPSRAKPSRE